MQHSALQRQPTKSVLKTKIIQLKTKPKKDLLPKLEVIYLGFLNTENGSMKDPSKNEPIRNYSIPPNP